MTTSMIGGLALPQTEVEQVRADIGSDIGSLDKALLVRVMSGDSDGLKLLFLRYGRTVRNIARRILQDDAEAEDLVQDLFIFIQRKCSTFDGAKSSVGSWIVHMAYQRAIDRKRRLTSRHFYQNEHVHNRLAQVVGMPTTENDYSPEAVFGRNGLEKVLSSLSEDQQETLRLFFFEGYTLAEISAKIGQSLANVRNHYYRGLDRVRKQMSVRKAKRG
jgi:RNA polymerase sigma-70 factor, ECF subfamily